MGAAFISTGYHGLGSTRGSIGNFELPSYS